MTSQFFNRCWLAVACFFFSATPLWAQGADGDPTERLIQLGTVIGLLVLTFAILLWPTKRDDTVLSFDEQQALKEEGVMKKTTGKN